MTSGASRCPDDEYKCTMVDISVDTFTSLIDAPQQDSGSNQSGSDSGLGCTNSLSSDNSSFNIVGQDRTNTATRKDSNNNINNSTANSDYIINRNNLHNGTISNLPSSSPKSSLKTIDETGTIQDEAKSKQLLSKSSNDHTVIDSEKNQLHLQPKDPLSISPLEQQGTPALKSLLKKPSVTNFLKRHNRHVSFNQTVTVFCEEFGASSPSDQFEPPLDYQDSHLTSFEPPENYCDSKEVRACVESGIAETIDHEVGDETSNLTDDQLFGLLENESLLESFKIDCDDFLGEEFPTNYLNSNHSYLRDNAISDSDTDSESSLAVEQNDPIAITNLVTGLRQSNLLTFTNSKQKKSTTSHPTRTSNHVDYDSSFNRPPSSCDSKPCKPQNTKQNSQKSMPARVKVTTVDNISKRQSNRTKDPHNQPKSDKQQTYSNHGQISQTTSKSKSDIQNGPVVITQSVVKPVALAKPKFVPTQSSEALQTETKPDFSAPTLLTFQETNLNKNDEAASYRTQPPAHNTQGQSKIANEVLDSQACHICRVIESRRPSTNKEFDYASMENSSKTFHGISQQNAPFDQQNQSAGTGIYNNTSLNQSCVSCQEASTVPNFASQEVHVSEAGTVRNLKPLACQVVYVVDQKGNRIRALSLMRPPLPQGSNSFNRVSLLGRNMVNNFGNVRFPNPGSVGVSYPNLLNQTRAVHSNQLTNAPPHYKLIATNSHLPNQHIVLHNPETSLRASIPTTRIPTHTPVPKQHTVYYVRQPLDAQTNPHSIDSLKANSRSFPDPHEIRRLDGLRGPTGLNFLCRPQQTSSSNDTISDSIKSVEVNARNFNQSKDEIDDPSFGFSKRPSVKVVSNNILLPTTPGVVASSHPRFDRSTISDAAQQVSSRNIIALRHVSGQPGGTRPVSVILLGSQTLDRRHFEQSCPTTKDSIPSTSSMSNIHGTLNNYAHPNSNQQQRISSKTTQEQTANFPKTKGIVYSSLRRLLTNRIFRNNFHDATNKQTN